MQDTDAGIPLDTHMCHKENKTHKLCFTGEPETPNSLPGQLILNFLIFHSCSRQGSEEKILTARSLILNSRSKVGGSRWGWGEGGASEVPTSYLLLSHFPYPFLSSNSHVLVNN